MSVARLIVYLKGQMFVGLNPQFRLSILHVKQERLVCTIIVNISDIVQCVPLW